jgi:hypothetical protein
MAKTKKEYDYEELFPDVQETFDKVIRNASGLAENVRIKVMALDNQKKIFTHTKTNKLYRKVTGIDVFVIINQRIFEGLMPDQQKMVAEEALCGISYSLSNSKILITQPDVKTYSGILRKYGYDVSKESSNTSYEVLEETVKSLFEKAKQDDAEEAND